MTLDLRLHEITSATAGQAMISINLANQSHEHFLNKQIVNNHQLKMIL